ncbi:prolyl oligopeptidase family serine peptidase [Myroides sp. mNGS23_01]|nr:prolyl oligopeptidase family serine peptidase [Myroides sp. mNGS23_01]WHT38763.1 prolyl oligopeptidase family serine peptidase [Myroides sp. mNGS23_01]
MIQGTADTNVPYTITQELVDHLKELGSPQVELLLVKGASHTQAIVQSTDQLIAFIKQYLPSKAND